MNSRTVHLTGDALAYLYQEHQGWRVAILGTNIRGRLTDDLVANEEELIGWLENRLEQWRSENDQL